MSSKRAYAGNTRMIEIGSMGVPFRILLNLDKVENIRFEEDREQLQIPNDDGVEAVHDEVTGAVIAPAVAPTMRTEIVVKGYCVMVQQSGQSAKISFPDLQSAMSCYNAIISMIQAVGVPASTMPSLRMPKPPEPKSPIVGVDGEAIKEAVDAADLHPDLAGGDGDGIAENDDGDYLEDENFELTEEELAQLENPEIDDPKLDS